MMFREEPGRSVICLEGGREGGREGGVVRRGQKKFFGGSREISVSE